VSKSKFLLAALLPFLFLQSSFSAEVIDGRKDTRRRENLVYAPKKADPSKSAAQSNKQLIKSANQRK